jgi:hypothetical protein
MVIIGMLKVVVGGKSIKAMIGDECSVRTFEVCCAVFMTDYYWQ